MPDTQTLELILTFLVALAVVIQAIALIIIMVMVRKSLRTALQQFEELRFSVAPIITNVQDLVQRLSPKITAVSNDLTEIAHKVRAQANDVQTTATELAERFRRQAARLDSMTTSVLDAVDRVGVFVSDAVAKPLRQLNGVLSSARAVVESLRQPVREANRDGNNATPPPHDAADKDMFV
jgi:methyl-accepting chemotaxis protein